MICTALLAVVGLDVAPAPKPVCAAVVEAAAEYHLPPVVLVSVAWHESRLDADATNPHSGAYGPLQVMPSLREADPVSDGARLLRDWMEREADATVEAPTDLDIERALCRYTCGYRCEAPCGWADRRMALAERTLWATQACYSHGGES